MPDLPPQLFGASTCNDPAKPQKEVQIQSADGDASAPKTGGAAEWFGFDLTDLWGGGYDEFVNEDAEQIGEAYEASILGGVLGIEDEEEEPNPEEANGTPGANSPARKKKDSQRKMSAKGLISNFVLSIIGSTTLGLAAQMKEGGWILPPLLVFAGYLIVCENTRLVNDTIDKMQKERGITVLAYPDFAKGAFGIWGKRLASVTSMCALIGMMCTTLVLEGQNFNFVLPVRWSWFGCTHCGHKWWALFLTPISMIYVFGNPGALMKKTAFLGPLVCFLTVVLAWAGAEASIQDVSEVPDVCIPDRTVLPSPEELFTGSMMMHLASAGSYGFYSFAVIVTVPTLRNQMKNEQKTKPAAIFAYSLSFLMFLPIMFLGYAGFGKLTPENLIDGMREGRPDGWWALNRPFETGTITGTGSCLDIAVTINLLLTEAIYIPCAIMAVEASFPAIFRRGPPWANKAMRLGFVCLRLFVATSVDSFVAMSSLVSSLFCVCNNILIPIAAFHWTRAREVGPARKVAHGCIFVYGIFILIMGTYSSMMSLTPHEVPQPGASLREGISLECKLAYERAIGSGL